MRKTVFSLIFVLIISSTTIPIFPLFISRNVNSIAIRDGISMLKTSALTEMNTTITIDDLPGSSTNWTWAKDQGYCTGLGTQSNPYVISDIFFNTSTISWNCITVINSRKHFVVRDCEFKGDTQYAGVQLFNTTNGIITENFMNPLTGALVWVYNSSYNVIQNNNASAGYYYGVLIDSTGGRTIMNVVSNNLITYNIAAGVQFRGGYSVLNTISNNYLYNNTLGIELGSFANNNTIKGNRIGNSTSAGITITIMSQYNKIYENCFFTNNLHANDNGLNNSWDNGVKGNYWDNYTGLDANNDGIGDVPFNITGLSESQDNFPLMSCPVSTVPSGIPGYDVFLLLFAGVASIIGIIYITKKRKIIN